MEHCAKKILFICGSLEPGHDGVGDYTRALAASLSKESIVVKILAIMDRSVSGSVNQTQSYGEISVSTLRLSKRLSLKDRKKSYQSLLSEFKPHWVSLQFVPYAFSKRGIPFWLVSFLSNISFDVKWHVMFHETYIGAGTSLKDQLIKKCQVVIIKQLVSRLKPAVVHTSTFAYQERLRQIGIKASLLGLFGNIPVVDNRPLPKKYDDKLIRGVYFGTVPRVAEFSNFARALRNFIEKNDVRLMLYLCGSTGVNGERFLKYMQNSINVSSLSIVQTGRLNEVELSKLFSKCNFGMARVPPSLIGKSGSAIAMLEHGLPLWIPLAKDQNEIERYCEFRKNQCFADLTIEIFSRMFAPKSHLNEVTKILVQELSLNFP